MGELRCVDGSRLEVIMVPVRDRAGTPYEVTLELRCDGRSFGVVGERCGYSLATLAREVADVRVDGSPVARAWPDQADRFPEPPASTAPGAREDRGLAAREPELFAFRRRDRADTPGTAELRCTLRTSCTWLSAPDHRGGEWRRSRRAVVEAWGPDGHGVRAVLTSAELAGFLTALVAEARLVGADYRDVLASSPVSARHAPSGAIIDC
ncbi:hypothetical protein [Actinoallomurus soli]|uniref:hypothetical protein n=1 Tax=Actinoallomurus soli TaxID=2952535 RepID=UPI002093CE43|nr:hypothetical protein [Actinoallomurus soli]MCO5972152.1 hypothetical protein [Actinoallomurus soli]